MPLLKYRRYRPNHAAVMVPAGASEDAATTAWVNAVVAAGGSVGATQRGYVNTLITSLKAHSLWTIQERIWLHASENIKQATIDIVNLGVATEVSSPSFTASQGYTGNGSSSYLDTGWSSGSNYTQNSASISAYIRTSRAGNNNYAALARVDTATTGTSDMIWPLSGGVFSYDVNDGAFSNQPANTNAQGFWTASRTGASTLALYKNSNSTAFGTATTASGSLASNTNFYIGARSNNNSAEWFSTDQIAITTIGAGMSAANVAQFQTDLNAYMTSLGTNVY